MKLGTFTSLIIGAVFLYFAQGSVKRQLEFTGSSETAVGQVVDLQASGGSDGDTYRPIVEFTTQQGQTVRFISNFSSNPPTHRRGKKVTVYYSPAKPELAKIKSFWTLWFAQSWLILFGVFFFVGPFWLFFHKKRKQKRDAYLMEFGERIEVLLDRVIRPKSDQAHGRYRIITRWKNQRTGRMHVFKSKYLAYDPTARVEDEKQKLYVFIDPEHPKKYAFDDSFLPEISDD